MSVRTESLRKSWVVIGIAAAFAAASPGFAADTLGAMLACRTINASAPRLACFDRESAALAAQRQPSAQRPSADMSAQTLSPRQTFGLAPTEIAARAEAAANVPKQLNAITARLTGLSKAPDGRQLFILDNGEVWVQLVGNGEVLVAKPGETVTISRGWLGSYSLSLPSHRGFKVTRVR